MVWLRTHLSRMSVTQGCDNVSQLPHQPYALSDTSTNDQKTTGKQTSHNKMYNIIHYIPLLLVFPSTILSLMSY